MGKSKKSKARSQSQPNPSSTTSLHSSGSPSSSEAQPNKTASKLFEVFTVFFALPLVVTYMAIEKVKGSHFLLRLLFCVTLDSAYGGAIATLLQPVARWIAPKLPGGVSSSQYEDSLQHDKTLTWPPSTASIPTEWQDLAKDRQRKLPTSSEEPLWFLNHVRGSLRFRQAALRVAGGSGTLLMAYVMTYYVDPVPEPYSSPSLSSIGLAFSIIDLGWGFLVGSSVIILLFIIEFSLGWIHIIGYFEKVAEDEVWTLGILWDVLFHLGVSISEEVSMRGWMLAQSVSYLSQTCGFSVTVSWGIAVASQAAWFALMHASSPGANVVGMLNLVVGGTAAALNVLVSGSLSFSLGWHFGWNLWMGHLLGLSTSGIPMSAKLVSIVPHPSKAAYHGGRFGPEQSPLAPLAYGLGVVALVAIYGTASMSQALNLETQMSGT